MAAADQLGHSPAAQVRLLRQWGAAVGRTRALAGLNSYCAATPAYPAHLRDELREHFDELFDVSDGATRHGLVAGVIVPTAVGPLTVGERVGSGGLGVVYAAHGAHGERYALKVLSDHRFELTPSVRQRFAREARVARGLEHANLVRTFDYLEIDGAAGIVLEYMGGGTLEQRLQRGRPTADEGRRWMLDLARGLACLHAAGVVHRDISARNVLFRDDATAALCDLGVARTTDDTQITVAGEQFGSLIYISPQQRRAPHEAEPRDDVYSLGLVFQYIATGVNPHAVRSPRGRTDHDDAIIELVEAMTVYDRDARPTAAEVVRWLEHPVPEDAALAVRFARALGPGPSVSLCQLLDAVTSTLAERSSGGVPELSALGEPWERVREDLTRWTEQEWRRGIEIRPLLAAAEDGGANALYRMLRLLDTRVTRSTWLGSHGASTLDPGAAVCSFGNHSFLAPPPPASHLRQRFGSWRPVPATDGGRLALVRVRLSERFGLQGTCVAFAHRSCAGSMRWDTTSTGGRQFVTGLRCDMAITDAIPAFDAAAAAHADVLIFPEGTGAAACGAMDYVDEVVPSLVVAGSMGRGTRHVSPLLVAGRRFEQARYTRYRFPDATEDLDCSNPVLTGYSNGDRGVFVVFAVDFVAPWVETLLRAIEPSLVVVVGASNHDHARNRAVQQAQRLMELIGAVVIVTITTPTLDRGSRSPLAVVCNPFKNDVDWIGESDDGAPITSILLG